MTLKGKQMFQHKNLVALLFGFGVASYAQDLAAVGQKLTSEYTLTQTTGAQDDIVTMGTVVVLKKGNLMMVPVSSTSLFHNTYKDGKLGQGAVGIADKAQKATKFLKFVPGVGSMAEAVPTVSTRAFVPGEKLYITKIEMKEDGVVFGLFTDAKKDQSGNDVHYKADLKFQFPKGFTLTAEQADKMVSDVFKVGDSAEANDGNGQQPSQPVAGSKSAVAKAEVAPPPIPPPPPPPADPKKISLGQTPTQVTDMFGQPTKIIDLGVKKIYSYPDMKVIFRNGKVADIQ